jgi:hypothetical protein
MAPIQTDNVKRTMLLKLLAEEREKQRVADDDLEEAPPEGDQFEEIKADVC